MRILYWTPRYWPDIGGTQVLAITTLAALLERGHDLLVLTTQSSPALPETAEHAGIAIRRMPFWSALNRKDLPLILKIKSQIGSLRQEFQPDLIHIDFSGYTAYFQVATAEPPPPPTVLAFHSDLAGLRLRADTTLRRLLELADWVTGVSHSTLDSVRQALPSIADRSSVIYGCPPNWNNGPTRLSSREPVVLGIGRLSPEKGFDILIEAAAGLIKKHPRLLIRIAGDGPERMALQRQADALGLRGKIEFLGSIANDELPVWIAAARAVIIPSRCREAFGMTAVEAASMARPVIATNAGGLAEVVVHGETGLLVEMEDPVSLADAIDQMIADPAKAEEMGLAAQRRAVQEFSLAQRANEYDALYLRLTAGIQKAA